VLEEVEENSAELDLDQDTYTMAFKALNWESQRQMDLNENEVHEAFQAAVFVFFIQMTLIVILWFIIGG
jgi:type IV secretory pathway component VirB8